MTNNIRILHIIPNFGPGGAERLVVDLMENTDKECFEVAAISLYPQSGTIFEREIQEKKLMVYYLNKHRGLDLRIILQLYYIFKTFKPHVVHTHLYVLRYALLPMLFCRVPVRVHTVHNVAQKEVDKVGKLVHWIAFRLGRVIPVSISQEVANTVKALYGKNIYTPVIYNGISTMRFIPKVERKNIKEEEDVVLLHIGRFAPQKNHLLLIEAFAQVVKEFPTMRLWLVGDGSLRPEIERVVKEKGLEEKVLLLGIRDDVPKLLEDSDIFALPSDWEGVPLTILEAMAAGKPVIATAVGGVPELIEDGVTGILVPPRNHEALTKGILCLAKDSALRKRMGEAGQKRALGKFDISKTAREYEDLYSKLLRKGV